VLLIAAGSSCNFVVTSTDGGLTESSAREEGYIDDGFVTTTTTTEEQPASFGIFCEYYNNSDSEEGVGVVMIVFVRLFYLLSLVLTFVLVIVTLLWSMHSSTSTSYGSYCNYNNDNNEDELWKRLARLSITSIICHVPVLLLLLDSRHHCTDDDDDDDDNDDDGGRCTLGNGSLSYFLSILALTSLILVVKFNTMPDWKEEYELWKLVRQRHVVEMEKLDDMTIEKKKKDGHNDVIEDPKNSTMMSDDDDYDNDDDNNNRENMDEERRVERRRCPTIPLVIQCPVSEDEDKNSSMMMTMTMMMMPTNDTSKSSRGYKGNIVQNETNERAEVKKCGGERQQRTSSSPTSVIVENVCCEFQPPLPTTPVCSVMVVTDEELGHHPSFNNTYLQLSFSTINNNQVQIMYNDDEVMHNNIPKSNDFDDTENVNPGNDPTRIVNLAKEGVHQYEDPELDMYPSDGSLSELSLDSDDDRQQSQQSISHSHQDACNDNKTKIAKADCSSIIYLSDSSADGEFTSDDNDSESEMYAIIAGVRKLNRRMSGKTAPQYKRRRRRKGTSDDVSTVKSFMSHGSLLDKIIHEESAECDVPSPPRMTISTRKKKKREDDHHHRQHDGEVDDCYPSLNNSNELTNYEELLQSLQSSSSVSEIDSMKNDHNPENDIHALLDRSGDFSCGDGGDAVSDSDESMSLRASQARKQRIVSAQRFSLLPHDSNKDEYDDVNVYNSCNSVNSDGVNFRGISNSPPSLAVIGAIACENELSDASKKHITDISSNSNHINSSWQARQVRMARLRMSRGEQEKPSPALEPEGKIIRAIDSIVTCYSDENSI